MTGAEGSYDAPTDVFVGWLRDEAGVSEYRRVVRESDGTIVISKFEPGFSQELFATIDLLAELFDEAVVGSEYQRLAQQYADRGQSTLRTAVWREASEAVLRRLCDERDIDEQRRMLILPGIESVQAVLDALLWSAPTISAAVVPRDGELLEYEAFLSGGTERDIFTRFYGTFEDRSVENYCPGAQFARRLVEQGWRICTRAQRESVADRRTG